MRASLSAIAFGEARFYPVQQALEAPFEAVFVE